MKFPGYWAKEIRANWSKKLQKKNNKILGFIKESPTSSWSTITVHLPASYQFWGKERNAQSKHVSCLSNSQRNVGKSSHCCQSLGQIDVRSKINGIAYHQFILCVFPCELHCWKHLKYLNSSHPLCPSPDLFSFFFFHQNSSSSFPRHIVVGYGFFLNTLYQILDTNVWGISYKWLFKGQALGHHFWHILERFSPMGMKLLQRRILSI